MLSSLGIGSGHHRIAPREMNARVCEALVEERYCLFFCKDLSPLGLVYCLSLSLSLSLSYSYSSSCTVACFVRCRHLSRAERRTRPCT